MTTTQSFRKKMLALLLIAGIVTLQSFTVVVDGPKTKGDITAKVNYLGIKDGQLLFDVSYAKSNTANAKQTEIAVLANGEYEIFDNTYRAQKGQVFFKIDLEGVNHVAFTISNNGQKVKYQFAINTEYKSEINVQVIE
jgi:hypothetical protein